MSDFKLPQYSGAQEAMKGVARTLDQSMDYAEMAQDLMEDAMGVSSDASEAEFTNAVNDIFDNLGLNVNFDDLSHSEKQDIKEALENGSPSEALGNIINILYEADEITVTDRDDALAELEAQEGDTTENQLG